MTQCSSEVTFENIGPQVTDFPASHRLNEICLMTETSFAGKLLDSFMVVVVYPAAASSSAKIAFIAIDHHTKTGSSIVIYGAQTFSAPQAADLVNNRNRLIVKESNLRIGRFSVIVHADPPANTTTTRQTAAFRKANERTRAVIGATASVWVGLPSVTSMLPPICSVHRRGLDAVWSSAPLAPTDADSTELRATSVASTPSSECFDPSILDS